MYYVINQSSRLVEKSLVQSGNDEFSQLEVHLVYKKTQQFPGTCFLFEFLFETTDVKESPINGLTRADITVTLKQ